MDPFKTQRLLKDFVEYYLSGCVTACSDLNPKVDTFKPAVMSKEELYDRNKLLTDAKSDSKKKKRR